MLRDAVVRQHDVHKVGFGAVEGGDGCRGVVDAVPIVDREGEDVERVDDGEEAGGGSLGERNLRMAVRKRLREYRGVGEVALWKRDA